MPPPYSDPPTYASLSGCTHMVGIGLNCRAQILRLDLMPQHVPLLISKIHTIPLLLSSKKQLMPALQMVELLITNTLPNSDHLCPLLFENHHPDFPSCLEAFTPQYAPWFLSSWHCSLFWSCHLVTMSSSSSGYHVTTRVEYSPVMPLSLPKNP